jgi:hypothetical protein
MLSPLHYQANQARYDDLRHRAERPSAPRERKHTVRARLATLLARPARSTQPTFSAPALSKEPAPSR